MRGEQARLPAAAIGYCISAKLGARCRPPRFLLSARQRTVLLPGWVELVRYLDHPLLALDVPRIVVCNAIPGRWRGDD
jgi:hypothetical protein